MKRIAIYDMDGTLVCSLHRYRAVDNKIDLAYWQANAHTAMQDSLLPLHTQYMADLRNPECYVIIATARVLYKPDMDFIDNVLGAPDYIISRSEGDNISGGLLKCRGLSRIFNLRQFKDIQDRVFYEDNIAYLKSVCDRFNIRGVYVPSKQGH